MLQQLRICELWNSTKDIIFSTVTMAQVKEPVVEPEELRSAVWSRTPSDIVNLIIEQSDSATLHIWSRTCSAFHRVSSALLWKEMYIGGKDLQKYWEWTQALPTPFLVRPENGGIVDFLIRGPAHEDFYQPSASRHEDLAASPRSRIRRLFLDAKPDPPRLQSNITSHELEITLGFFALFMTRLDALQFDGPLYQDSMGQIVKIGDLKHLVLKRWKNFTQNPKDVSHMITRGPHILPWMELTIDFTCLSIMHSLRNLHIDQLVTLEARGLAKAVRHLQQLTVLVLSALFSLTGTDDTKWFAGSPGDVSPFVPFLEALCSRGDEAMTRPGNGIPGGFPRMLQTLVLDDQDHRQFPSLKWVLENAIEPCQNLRHVILNFRDHTIARDFLCSLGLPVQQDGTMVGWELLCSVAGLEFGGSAAWKQACFVRFRNTDDRMVEITMDPGSDSDETF